MTKSFSVQAKPIDFQAVRELGKGIEVVEWLWSGIEDPDETINIIPVTLLALVDGTLVSIENIPMKQSYRGPSNKFKGFVYSQIMKLGVPFRNLFKNLNVDTHVEESEEDPDHFDLEEAIAKFEYEEER